MQNRRSPALDAFLALASNLYAQDENQIRQGFQQIQALGKTAVIAEDPIDRGNNALLFSLATYLYHEESRISKRKMTIEELKDYRNNHKSSEKVIQSISHPDTEDSKLQSLITTLVIISYEIQKLPDDVNNASVEQLQHISFQST